jgi:ATP-dependent exoDNAse (exonuclease V) beta subunit
MPNFLIYKSSAGSGKTYTLVKEYLKIVLRRPEEFKNILAVTFTNKASDEMKSRIIQKLRDLSEGNDEALEKALADEGIKTDIKLNAGIVLNKVLHSYSDFSVLTIDSFLLKVVRAFSKELRLQLGYEIEIDTNSVMEHITEKLLDDIGRDKELTKYLVDFAFSSMDENKGWKIDKAITKTGMEIFKERHWIHKLSGEPDVYDDRQKLRELIKRLFDSVKVFEKEMLECSIRAENILDEHGLLMADISNGKNGVAGYLLNSLRDNNKYEPKVRPIEAAEEPSKWHTKTSDKKIQILKAVNNGLMDVLRKALKNYNVNGTNYYTARELVKTIYVLGIFNDLVEKLKNYRDEKRILLISDLNNILLKVTSDNNTPFVFEKIGNYYKYFLIDEFQDTSNFQWQNILPLIINSLSENNFSMVVGDVKQSIYRWRGGNLKLLMEKIYGDLNMFRPQVKDELLLENRRSRFEIVNFNNKSASGFINNWSGDISSNLFERAYTDCEQSTSKCPEGGYVEISFVNDDEENELKALDIVYKKTLDTVNDALNSEYRLKDILVLVRTNYEGTSLAGYLLDKGIRVISNESLFVINSPKVKLLINLLRYILDNKNDLAKTEILLNWNYLTKKEFCFSEIFDDHNKTTDALFERMIPAEFFFSDENGVNYKKINSSLHNLSLYDMVELLSRIFNLNADSDAYLLRFMDVILEYLKSNISDIAGFLDWWEDHKYKSSIIVPEQEDAVKVMTIHSAKGLQNKIVILPFANWNMAVDGNKETIWVSTDADELFKGTSFLVRAVKELKSTHFRDAFAEEQVMTFLDNLNLLYVAMTRAIDRLYVFVPPSIRNLTYSAGKLLSGVIAFNENFIKNYDRLNLIYKQGVKSKNTSVSKENYNSININKLISSDWTKRIIIKPKHTGLKEIKKNRVLYKEPGKNNE